MHNALNSRVYRWVKGKLLVAHVAYIMHSMYLYNVMASLWMAITFTSCKLRVTPSVKVYIATYIASLLTDLDRLQPFDICVAVPAEITYCYINAEQ